MRKRPVAERFWEKVLRASDEECWKWKSAHSIHGYAIFAPEGRGNRQAHRVAYELAVGPIPDGLVLDHLCRNRWCVNPNHVEPVTQSENTRRGNSAAAQTAKAAARTACKNGHTYTLEGSYVDSRGARCCRQCAKDRFAKWKESHV